jgi:hypothetical protein
MTFIPVDRVEQVWQAAMGLSLDARAAELVEAGDLIEEAGELLERARRKTGNRAVAAAGDENGRPARPPVATKPAAKKPAAKKPAAKKPAARRAPAKTTTTRPKAAPAKPKGAAKKTTAARGRSGRKK